jgi:hypothetical protein
MAVGGSLNDWCSTTDALIIRRPSATSADSAAYLTAVDKSVDSLSVVQQKNKWRLSARWMFGMVHKKKLHLDREPFPPGFTADWIWQRKAAASYLELSVMFHRSSHNNVYID